MVPLTYSEMFKESVSLEYVESDGTLTPKSIPDLLASYDGSSTSVMNVLAT